MTDDLLTIRDLRVYFHSTRGEYKVVDGVNLGVRRNEILGLAGESGSGKSTVIEAIGRLIEPPGYIAAGEIIFKPQTDHQPTRDANPAFESQLAAGVDLVTAEQPLLQYLRWRHMSYIPQASMNALNPIMRIKRQMVDAITAHTDLSETDAHQRAAEVLDIVKLPPPVLEAYPHELSGGMKQRAIIAIGMTLNPQLIVADEPTTALDVNVQRAILDALLRVKAETDASILFVSHDLAIHAELVDRMAIMYAGKIVEVSPVHDIFAAPKHPYTQQLLKSAPTLGGERVRQETVLGRALDRLNWPSGCRFHQRCPFVMERCKHVEPPLVEVAPGRSVACHLHYDVETQQVINADEFADGRTHD
ncbi:MAG: ABC transporter ATP-binding protein [Chloroflexi bacterium]|nr:ABC transporter ATP-binding protein [Chloroflexota bacterium]